MKMLEAGKAMMKSRKGTTDGGDAYIIRHVHSLCIDILS